MCVTLGCSFKDLPSVKEGGITQDRLESVK